MLMRKQEHELALFRKARTHNSKPLRNKEHQFMLFRTFGTYNNTLIALRMLKREKYQYQQLWILCWAVLFYNGSEPMMLDHQVVQFWKIETITHYLPLVCLTKLYVGEVWWDAIPIVFAAGFTTRCGMPPKRRGSPRQTCSFSTDIQDHLSRSRPRKPDILGKCSQITQISLEHVQITKIFKGCPGQTWQIWQTHRGYTHINARSENTDFQENV